MSYNTAIPQVTDQLLQSQKQILSNYQTIASVFGANHYLLTGEKNYQGMHTVLTMQPQGGDPSTGAAQVALYNKLVSSTPELFFMPNSAQTPIQLTYPSINTTLPSISQYSFVAGPFVIYGGKVVNPVNGVTITLSPTTNIQYVGLTVANYKTGQATFTRSAAPININSPVSSFTISYETHSSPATPTQDIFYLAIGQ